MSKPKAPPKFKPHKPSTADTLNLGSNVATAKASVPPKVWKAFVRRTLAKGYTVEGQLSGAPAPLRARTDKSLRHQAASTIARAYAPVDKALSDQEKRLRALDAKRSADHITYTNWLTTQNAAIDTSQKAANALLDQRAQQIHDDALASWQAMGDHVSQQLSAQAQVSDPSQSSVLSEGVPAAAAKGISDAAAAQAQNTAIQAAGVDTSAGVDKSVLLASAGMDAQRRADFDKGLQAIFSTKAQAKIDRAKDYLSTFGNLKSQELDKASKVQDFNALAQKLGVQQNALDLKSMIQGQNLKLNYDKLTSSNANASASRDLQQARINLSLNKSDLNGDGVVDQKDYKLKKQIDKQYGSGGKHGYGTTAGDRKNSRTQYQAVSTALGVLKDLHTQFPTGVDKKGRHFRQHMRAMGYSDVMIDVAEDLRTHGGKLSAAGLKKAKALGIITPGKLFGRVTAVQSIPGVGAVKGHA